MTSQTLMPSSISELPKNQAELSTQGSASVSTTANPAVKEPVCLAKSVKLPYQESHKEELMHLQADIEALIQQLQSLKQQRRASEEHAEEAVVHALV